MKCRIMTMKSGPIVPFKRRTLYQDEQDHNPFLRTRYRAYFKHIEGCAAIQYDV